jgi:hypothetical protein
MSAFRAFTLLAGLASVAACTTTAPPQGVGFGATGGMPQMSAAPASPQAAYTRSGTTAYDDGIMYGRLTRVSQGGADSAILEDIRYHNVLDPLLFQSPNDAMARFGARVAEMTGCQVRNVNVRSSGYSLSKFTAFLDCY